MDDTQFGELMKKLNGILVAMALKEKERKDQIKILKSGGFTQPEIIKVIGIAESTKRVRKLRAKKGGKK